jgi:hypothetical protein
MYFLSKVKKIYFAKSIEPREVFAGDLFSTCSSETLIRVGFWRTRRAESSVLISIMDKFWIRDWKVLKFLSFQNGPRSVFLRRKGVFREG